MQKVTRSKKIKPEASVIKYHPLIDDLVLTMDIQFHYNYETHQFELNQDPYGDPELVAIHHVTANEDFSQLSFEANADGLPQQFVVTAEHPTEKAMIELLVQVNSNGSLTVGEDLDHLQFIFDNGKLESVEIFKHDKDFNITESLMIASDKGGYELIIPAPYQKIKLRSIEVNDNKLISRSADREFVFKFDTQPVIVEAIKKLMAAAM